MMMRFTRTPIPPSAAAWTRWCPAVALLACALAGWGRAEDGRAIDTLVVGDAASEQSHGLTQDHSEVIRGGLGEPARQLLPLEPVSHNGGFIRFNLKVDPERQTFLTVKLWGSDCGADRGRLILSIDGLQAGYRHEGDHDVLNQCDAEPLYRGRFVYQTVILPPALTKGKSQVDLKIAGLGPMWAYGADFAQKQHTLTKPTRGIYRIYTHTETPFVPDAAEKQGECAAPAVRPAGDGEELIGKMKDTVNSRLEKLMESGGKGNGGKGAEGKILLLAEAWHTPWTKAYQNPKAITALVRIGDEFLKPDVIGKSWTGAGPLGEAILRVGAEPLRQALGETLEVPAELPFLPTSKPNKPGMEPTITAPAAAGNTVRMTRREAWSRMLRGSVDWNREHNRRFYTNQSMILDRNIYTANRGLMVIDPAKALPEKQAMRYIHEAIGLLPWLGNDTPNGGSEKPYGENYYQITRKGLSRELGFVATYGETILKFGRDIAELTGDEKVRAQIVRMEAARMFFRYPGQDADGFRCMKLASEIDNRTAHFPHDEGTYGIANVREAWWMEMAAFFRDPVAVGAAQQCLEDNQYFPRLATRAKDDDTLGMMRNITEYAAVKAMPKSSYRLPMTDGQPDFVFSDEENAVVAIKHGTRKLFVNFYYRQEFGVSGVTRILDLSPTLMRLGTIQSQFEVDTGGAIWTRPDIIDFERSGGFPPPGENIHQAWAGEKLPIAKRPPGVSQPADGKWGPFVGKAAFYHLRYGNFLIGVNTTAETTRMLPVPAGITRATDLVSGAAIKLGKEVAVKPLTTVVLDLGGAGGDLQPPNPK